MCAGDMTPIPVKYRAGIEKNYVVSDVMHTCRNFDRLRDWMLERFYVGTSKELRKTLKDQ